MWPFKKKADDDFVSVTYCIKSGKRNPKHHGVPCPDHHQDTYECSGCGISMDDPKYRKNHPTIKVSKPPAPSRKRICDIAIHGDSVSCKVCRCTFDYGDEKEGCPNKDVLI